MESLIESIRVTTEPTAEPLTLPEVKSHLRITIDAEDALLTTYIASARRWAENFTHRALINTSYEQNYSRFPDEFELPRGKTQSVESVTYVDTSGSRQTLTGPSTSPVGTEYQEDLASDEGGLIMRPYNGTWPGIRSSVYKSVSVNFTAGYGTDENAVPDDIRHAMLLKVADAFEIRATLDLMRDFHSEDMGKAAALLLIPYVIRRFHL